MGWKPWKETPVLKQDLGMPLTTEVTDSTDPLPLQGVRIQQQ
jgi:hypothetical protein